MITPETHTMQASVTSNPITPSTMLTISATAHNPVPNENTMRRSTRTGLGAGYARPDQRSEQTS